MMKEEEELVAIGMILQTLVLLYPVLSNCFCFTQHETDQTLLHFSAKIQAHRKVAPSSGGFPPGKTKNHYKAVPSWPTPARCPRRLPCLIHQNLLRNPKESTKTASHCSVLKSADMLVCGSKVKYESGGNFKTNHIYSSISIHDL